MIRPLFGKCALSVLSTSSSLADAPAGVWRRPGRPIFKANGLHLTATEKRRPVNLAGKQVRLTYSSDPIWPNLDVAEQLKPGQNDDGPCT